MARLSTLARVAPAARVGGRRWLSTVPTTMKAAVVREVGGADALKIETDYPVPSISDGQVGASTATRAARRAA